MKIHKISAKNINSFKEEISIDFQKFLRGRGLFAIVGEIGSGKSTLLDIITCALYAKTPRLNNPKELMSIGRGECYCEVEFEIDGILYRSSWSLRRARGRHDGKFQNPKMELSLADSGEILESKASLVPKRVEEITGLDFARFTQSMMLAQGAFDAFLHAKEKERSALLEKITGTKIYSDISKLAYSSCKKTEDDLNMLKAKTENITFLDEDEYSNIQKELSEIDSKKIAIREQKTYLQDMLLKKREFINIKRELEIVSEEKERLKSEKKRKSYLFDDLSKAKSALILRDSYRVLEEKREYQKELCEILDRLNEELISKEEDYHKFSKIYKILPEFEYILEFDKDIEAEDINIFIKNIKDKIFLSKNKIDKYYTHLKTAKKRVDYSSKNYNRLYKEFLEFDENEDSIREDFEKLKDIKKAIEKNIKDSFKKSELLKKRDTLLKSIKSSMAVLNNLKHNIHLINEYLESLKKQRELELLIKKYDLDRERLKKDEPCFLCGSTKHPYIENGISVEPEETALKIESQRERLSKENRKKEEIQEKISKETQELKDTKERIIEIDNSLKTSRAVFEVYGFKADTKSLERLSADIESLKIELQERKIIIDELKKAEIEKEKDLKYLKDIEHRLSMAKDENREMLHNLEIAWRDIKNSIHKQSTLLEESIKLKKRDISEIKNRLEIVKSELIEMDREFEKSLLKEGFLSFEEFLKTLNIDIDSLESKISILKEQESEIRIKERNLQDRLSVLEKEELSSDTLEELEESIKKAEVLYDELSRREGEIKSILDSSKRNLENYQKVKEEILKKRQKSAVLIKLNELIGSADGSKFSKFAQGITMDYLISLANRHLAFLSDRYTIIRKERESLDIYIADSYQANEIRSSNTLSGGESFLVSLALALGLSDLASRNISIDSMFLDEGFGSLDSETLDIAISALERLESSGKILGIISHLDIIKDRISTQIEIIKKGGGESEIRLKG